MPRAEPIVRRASRTAVGLSLLAASSLPCLGTGCAASPPRTTPLSRPNVTVEPAPAEPDAKEFTTRGYAWVTAESLLPSWGFYENASAYGDTRPLKVQAALCFAKSRCTLTWVTQTPSAGEYWIWVRRYAGTGNVRVDVDERAVGNAASASAVRYVWQPAGKVELAAGRHHIDVNVVGVTSVDAILLTTNPTLDPATAPPLAPPIAHPRTSAPRLYRDDEALLRSAGGTALVAGQVPLEAEIVNDWLPAPDAPPSKMELWGAADQYAVGALAVRLFEAGQIRLDLSPLRRNDGALIGGSNLDVRVVVVRTEKVSLYSSSAERPFGNLLLREDTGDWPPRDPEGGFGGATSRAKAGAHESRTFRIAVRVPPNTTPGEYRGAATVLIEGSKSAPLNVPVELTVLPIELRPPSGYYAIFYPVQADDPAKDKYVPPAEYEAELRDMVEHGLNSTAIYGSTFKSLDAVKAAGMTKPPCAMHWPESDAASEVAYAKKLGLEGVSYWGVDEPKSDAEIGRPRTEALRRKPSGLQTLMSVNTVRALTALQDVIERPVLATYVFSGAEAAKATTALRAHGAMPLSYWMTQPVYPIYHRALTGLYNTAMGFDGSMPWAYRESGLASWDAMTATNAETAPGKEGRPVPTLAWEAHREGITDVRYLDALDAAIQDATKRAASANSELRKALEAAKTARAMALEHSSDPWFRYMAQLEPGDLDKIRRSMAEAIVALRRELAGPATP